MVEGNDEKLTIETLKSVFFKCKDVYDKYSKYFVYFDKMKSPVKRINNNYRFQVLARVNGFNEEIINEFYNIANENNINGVNCYLEVNPSSMN
jgi:primosomal protein N'